MSTRSSIKWREQTNEAPGYHMYEDVFDDDPRPVYLRFDGVQVELMTIEGAAAVTITLPRETAQALGLLPAPGATPESAEPVAWMVLAANTRKPCEVTLYKSETEALRQDCVVPLCVAPQPATSKRLLHKGESDSEAPQPASEPASSCDPGDICAGRRCKYNTYAQPASEQQAYADVRASPKSSASTVPLRKGEAMLARWVNVLPLFVVRWLAVRYCERFPWYYEGRVKRTLVCALPDCYFKVEGESDAD